MENKPKKKLRMNNNVLFLLVAVLIVVNSYTFVMTSKDLLTGKAASAEGSVEICIGQRPTLGNPAPQFPIVVTGIYNATVQSNNTNYVNLYHRKFGTARTLFGTDYDVNNDTIYNATLNATSLPDGNCNYQIIAEAVGFCSYNLFSNSEAFTVNNIDSPPIWDKFKNNLSTNFSNMTSWVEITSATISIPQYGSLSFGQKNFDEANLDYMFNISYNLISLNTSPYIHSCFDAQQYIFSFYNVTKYAEPVPLKNGVYCNSCVNFTDNEGNYSFVSTSAGHNVFSVGEGGNISINFTLPDKTFDNSPTINVSTYVKGSSRNVPVDARCYYRTDYDPINMTLMNNTDSINHSAQIPEQNWSYIPTEMGHYSNIQHHQYFSGTHTLYVNCTIMYDGVIDESKNVLENTTFNITYPQRDRVYYEDGDDILIFIRLEESNLTINADFSEIDSNFNPVNVIVNNTDLNYTIGYTISSSNTRPDGQYNLTIEAFNSSGHETMNGSIFIHLNNNWTRRDIDDSFDCWNFKQGYYFDEIACDWESDLNHVADKVDVFTVETSCFDGIDNDYDTDIDANDTDCAGVYYSVRRFAGIDSAFLGDPCKNNLCKLCLGDSDINADGVCDSSSGVNVQYLHKVRPGAPIRARFLKNVVAGQSVRVSLNFFPENFGISDAETSIIQLPRKELGGCVGGTNCKSLTATTFGPGLPDRWIGSLDEKMTATLSTSASTGMHTEITAGKSIAGVSAFQNLEFFQVLSTAILNESDNATYCFDGIDNDLQGSYDCLDATCNLTTNPANPSQRCEYPNEITCLDGYDNDWDGYTDCQDSDCFMTGGLFGPCYTVENYSATSCSDNINNDYDWGFRCDASTSVSYQTRQTVGNYSNAIQLIDCADVDCDGSIGNQTSGAVCEHCNERTCDDQFDNDGDNYYDCTGNAWRTGYERDCDRWHDPLPAVLVTCPTIETICYDNIDNDLDSDSPGGEYAWLGLPVYGGWDCQDLDCHDRIGNNVTGALCEYRNETICDDGFDNDRDSYTDCYDNTSCRGLGGLEFGMTGLCRPCPATENITLDSCRDGEDNDFDGDIDCQDSDCYSEAGPGRILCGITELNCTDLIDNDLDGLIDFNDTDCTPPPSLNELVPAGCIDGLDNDADNVTDCNDPDCENTIFCREGVYEKVPTPVEYTGYLDLSATKYIAAGDNFTVNYSTIELGYPLEVDSMVLKLGNAEYSLRGIAPVIDTGTFAIAGNSTGFATINDTYGIKVQKMDGFNGTLNMKFVAISGSGVTPGEYEVFVSSSMPGDYSQTTTTIYVSENEIPLVRDVDINIGTTKVAQETVNVTLQINVSDTGSTYDSGIALCDITVVRVDNDTQVHRGNASFCIDSIPLTSGTYNVTVTAYDGAMNPSSTFSSLFTFETITVPAQDGNFYNIYPAENFPDKNYFNHTENLNIGLNFDGGRGYENSQATECIVKIRNRTSVIYTANVTMNYTDDYASCVGQVELGTLFNLTRGANRSIFPEGVYFFTVSVFDNESIEGQSEVQEFNFCRYKYDPLTSKYTCWDACETHTLSNSPPVFTGPIPNMTWPRGTKISIIDLDDYFYDPDGDPIYFTWDIDTPRINVSIDRSNIVTFNPELSFYGIAHITFYANDAVASTPSNQITLEVEFVDLPPPIPIPAGGGGGGGGAVNKTKIEQCEEDWTCADWGPCLSSGWQFRNCRDRNECGTSNDMPNTTRACMYIPTCRDRLRNQGEIGIDCGGPCPPCPSCTDSVLNQQEVKVAQIILASPKQISDCGGPFCPACPSCDDNRHNGDEEGVDCGGECRSCASCDDGIRNQGEVNIDCGGPCPSCKVSVKEIAFNWNLVLLIVSSIVLLSMVFIALLFGIFKKKFIRLKAKLLNYYMRSVRMFEKRKVVEKELPILQWINTHLATIEEGIQTRTAEQSVNAADRLVRIFFKRVFLIRYAFTNDELVKDLEKAKIPVVLRKATELLFEELSQIKYGGESIEKDDLRTLIGQIRVIAERLVNEIETKKKTKINISERDISKISETLAGAHHLGVGEALKKIKK